MSDFEQKLREALRPAPPPDGFGERTLGRIAGSGRPGSPPSMAVWVAGLVALLVLAAGIFGDAERARRVRGERAKEEVLLALRVAGVALNDVEDRVRQAQPLRVRPEDN